MKKSISYLSCCLVFVLVLTLVLLPFSMGCKEKEKETVTVQSIYKFGVTAFPKTTNPFAGTTGPSHAIPLSLVYETLVLFTMNGDVIPWLAKSWEFDSTSYSWTLHINENARFNDGQPVTAKDVKYSCDKGLELKLSQFAQALATVKSITVVDSKTIKFALNEPLVSFIANLSRCYIVPEYIWSTVGDVMTYENKNPVGSGPFFWTATEANASLTFTKNPNYWNGPANVDQVIIILYGTAESQLLALKNGDIDAVSNLNLNTAVPGLVRDSNMAVVIDQQNTTMQLYLNFRFEPFNIKEFRKALNIAVDRKLMVSNVLYGYGEPALQVPIARIVPGANLDTKFPYIEKTQAERTTMANAILDAIPDMSKIGSDGLRTYKGEKLIFEILTATTVADVQVGGIVIDNAKSLGIQLKPKAGTTTLVMDTVFRNGGLAPKGWQIALWGGPDDPTYDHFASQWCGSPADPSFRSVAAGWTNSSIQSLILQTRSETDTKKREALMKQTQLLWAEEVPNICLYNPFLPLVHRVDRFTGWKTAALIYGGNVWSYAGIINILSLKPIQS